MTIVAQVTFAPRWECTVGGGIARVAPSPDSRWVAVALAEGPVVVLDASSGELLRIVSGHAVATTDVAWTLDGTRLITCGQDGLARVWEAATGAELVSVAAGSSWAERVAVCPDGARFASAAGRRVRLWSLDGRLQCDWPERASTILDLAWRPGPGRPRLAAVSYGAVGLYDPSKPTRAARELKWQGSSLVIAWNPSGEVLATGDQDASVHYWVLKTGRDLMMAGYPRKVRELAWDRTGRWLATGGGFQVIVWDCAQSPAGTEPLVLEHHDVPLCALAYQHHGEFLASAALDGSLAIWDPARSPAPLASLDGEGDEIGALAWSRDDSALFVGYQSGTVASWSPAAP